MDRGKNTPYVKFLYQKQAEILYKFNFGQMEILQSSYNRHRQEKK